MKRAVCPLCGVEYSLTHPAGRFRQHRVQRITGPDGVDMTKRTSTGAVETCHASGYSPEEAAAIAARTKP